jgi:mannose-6-phosphate isomerase-like protein (cupin superfamily)
LASGARIPTIRMVADGTPLPHQRYCSPTRLGGRTLDDVVDPIKVVARLSEGATLVLQSLHRTLPSVGAFVGALQHEISHPVQANAYLTPPGAAGLAEHADLHDVFALQLDGTKQWWIDGLGEITVQPGDVLYVPRGVRHRAATGGSTSLHLTIGVIRVTYRQVIDRMLRDGPETLDALRLLSAGRPVRVGALPGLDEPSRVVLAKRLVREAACVIDDLG